MSPLPHGFVLEIDFLSMEEERRYLTRISALSFQTVSMRGRQVRRQILAFGVGFGANFQSTVNAPPIPRHLHALRRRATDWVGKAQNKFTQALIQRYPRGATIGWHRDSSCFGSPIVGISLGGAARLLFRNGSDTTVGVTIPPRSIYMLSGSCRWCWQHAISAVRELRYSITFRTMSGNR
jgi:alkylated DNA repair protein (DNA oxidative demethylase)